MATGNNRGTHILGSFDASLRQLRQGLLEMGSLVEQQLQSCLQLLQSAEQDSGLGAGEITAREAEINRKELDIYADIVACFCRHQPVASDVRLCVSYLRMSADIERIGDEAEHVFFCLKSLNSSALQGVLGEKLSALLEMDRAALQRALSALADTDRSSAQKVIDRDLEINEQQRQVQQTTIDALRENRVDVEDGVHLIQAARALERVGDHAKNLSQAVIYAATGDDTRSSEVAAKAEYKSAQSGK